MADFKQVLEWLSQGKKIRHQSWIDKCYIYLINGKILDQDDEWGFLYLNQFHSPEWELYEEKSQQHTCARGGMLNRFYVDEVNGTLFINHDHQHIKIDFCPFCGKKAGS